MLSKLPPQPIWTLMITVKLDTYGTPLQKRNGDSRGRLKYWTAVRECTTGHVLKQGPLGIATKKSTGSLASKKKAADTGASVEGCVQRPGTFTTHLGIHEHEETETTGVL